MLLLSSSQGGADLGAKSLCGLKASAQGAARRQLQPGYQEEEHGGQNQDYCADAVACYQSYRQPRGGCEPAYWKCGLRPSCSYLLEPRSLLFESVEVTLSVEYFRNEPGDCNDS